MLEGEKSDNSGAFFVVEFLGGSSGMEYVEPPLHCGGYIVNNHILSRHHNLPSPLETEVGAHLQTG